MVGYLLGVAPTLSLELFRLMDPEELQFRYYWTKEVERERMLAIGKMLGTSFTAGEIRKWAEKGEEGGTARQYKNRDIVFSPLSLAIRPELRDILVKTVGAEGLMLPKDYRGRKNEVMVDLGQVTTEEFVDFVKNRKLPDPTPRSQQED